MPDMNFVCGKWIPQDIDLFFDGEDVVEIEGPETKLLAHLMHRAGLFPSIGQARKAGWDKPIPPGFSQFRVGKRKHLITILFAQDDRI